MNHAQKVRLSGWGLLALLAVCLAYSNSFENSFHFDDFHTITDNPQVRSLHNLPRFFTDARTFSVLPANRTYRPIVSASLAFDYALGRGYHPWAFHLSTFFWFAGLLVLLFLLYRDLFERTASSAGNVWLALLGATWFGLHPAIAETINYIIQRGDVYCTTGCVGALVLYARYPQRRRYCLYLLPVVFALLSKPPAAVFPVLLFFYVLFFEASDNHGRLQRGLLASFPSAAVVAAVMSFESAMTPKSFTPSIIPAWDYRLTQPFVWLRYFGELFLPIHLNVDTDLAPLHNFGGSALSGLCFLSVLCAAIWLTARRRLLHPIAYGLIWFIVTQLPTSLYPLSEVENDHRMFFSFAGLIPAILWSAWLLLARMQGPIADRRLRPVLVGCVLFALTGYAWGVHLRNRVWRDEESLWLDDVQKSPHNGRGLMIYGLTLMNKGAYPEALDFFNRALLYTANYATLEINLGVVNGAMGLSSDAERHFIRAIALAPRDDEAHSYYGRWLIENGRTDEAIAQLRTAIAINPQRPLGHEQLLTLYAETGDNAALQTTAAETLEAIPEDSFAKSILAGQAGQGVSFWLNTSLDQYRRREYEQSIESARHALQLDANSAEAFNNIGASYGAMQRWDDAIQNEREALRLNPALQIAKNNLVLFQQQKGSATLPLQTQSVATLIDRSLALNQAGKYQESIDAAQAALRIDSSSAEAWNNIAAADEAMHRWQPAIDAARKAIALKPDFELAKNNLAWSLSQQKLAVH